MLFTAGGVEFILLVYRALKPCKAIAKRILKCSKFPYLSNIIINVSILYQKYRFVNG